MDKMKYTLRLIGGVTLFLVCGCHSPYSYQPYGYTGSPGFYAPQQPAYPGTGYPGAVYPGTQPGVVGGGVYPGTTYPGYPGGYPPVIQGQPLVPDTTVPGSTYGGDPMYVPGGTGDTWNRSDTDTLDGYGGTYGDDNSNIEPVPQPSDPGDTNFFEDDLGGAQDSFGSRPFDEDDNFEQPVAARKPIQNASYGFDKVQYRWLKGILKRDPKTNDWHIVYNLSGNDKYGGDLMVADDARFSQLRDGEIVELTGVIDPNVKAANGDPVYRVTAATRIAPREVH